MATETPATEAGFRALPADADPVIFAVAGCDEALKGLDSTQRHRALEYLELKYRRGIAQRMQMEWTEYEMVPVKRDKTEE